MHQIYIKYMRLLYPRSRSGRRADAETGSEVFEQDTWKTFSEDVRNLVARWDVENSYLTPLYLFPNKVNVNFNMLCLLMLNWIVGEIYRTDVVFNS